MPSLAEMSIDTGLLNNDICFSWLIEGLVSGLAVIENLIFPLFT